MVKIKMKQFLSLKTSEDNSCKEYRDGGYAKCVDDKVHQVILLHSNLKHYWIVLDNFDSCIPKSLGSRQYHSFSYLKGTMAHSIMKHRFWLLDF